MHYECSCGWSAGSAADFYKHLAVSKDSSTAHQLVQARFTDKAGKRGASSSGPPASAPTAVKEHGDSLAGAAGPSWVDEYLMVEPRAGSGAAAAEGGAGGAGVHGQGLPYPQHPQQQQINAHVQALAKQQAEQQAQQAARAQAYAAPLMALSGAGAGSVSAGALGQQQQARYPGMPPLGDPEPQAGTPTGWGASGSASARHAGLQVDAAVSEAEIGMELVDTPVSGSAVKAAGSKGSKLFSRNKSGGNSSATAAAAAAAADAAGQELSPRSTKKKDKLARKSTVMSSMWKWFGSSPGKAAGPGSGFSQPQLPRGELGGVAGVLDAAMDDASGGEADALGPGMPAAGAMDAAGMAAAAAGLDAFMDDEPSVQEVPFSRQADGSRAEPVRESWWRQQEQAYDEQHPIDPMQPQLQAAGGQLSQPATSSPYAAVAAMRELEAVLTWQNPWRTGRIFGSGLYLAVCVRQLAKGHDLLQPSTAFLALAFLLLLRNLVRFAVANYRSAQLRRQQQQAARIEVEGEEEEQEGADALCNDYMPPLSPQVDDEASIAARYQLQCRVEGVLLRFATGFARHGAALVVCGAELLSGQRPVTSALVAALLWGGMVLGELRIMSQPTFWVLCYIAAFTIPAAYVRCRASMDASVDGALRFVARVLVSGSRTSLLSAAAVALVLFMALPMNFVLRATLAGTCSFAVLLWQAGAAAGGPSGMRMSQSGRARLSSASGDHAHAE